MAKRKKKEVEVQRPLITRHCKKCGKWWIAKHPKDDEEYCERCRENEQSECKG